MRKLARVAAPAAVLPDVSSLVRALVVLVVYGLLIPVTRAVPEEVIELISRLPRRARG